MGATFFNQKEQECLRLPFFVSDPKQQCFNEPDLIARNFAKLKRSGQLEVTSI